MKAEDVFNIAIHLSDYELQRLNNLTVDKLKLKTEKVLKKLFKTQEQEEMMIHLIKLCFSKVQKIEQTFFQIFLCRVELMFIFAPTITRIW